MGDKLIIFLFSAIIYFAEQGDARIDRPCQLGHYQCIGDNLAANARCNKNVKGAASPEYYIPTFHFETPFFNSSYAEQNLYIRNQHLCKVSEFFINTDTARAVLSIDCPNLQLEADRDFIQHASYKEDIYYKYHITALYPLIRITINFPRGNLNLCSARVFTDVAVLPVTNIIPIDLPTFNALSRNLSFTNIFERENYLTRGKLIASLFVQSALCDYGCPLPL